MDTLLTEIIGFIRNCEGNSGLRGGNAAAVLILARSACKTALQNGLSHQRSAPVASPLSASRLRASYRGFARMVADQNLGREGTRKKRIRHRHWTLGQRHLSFGFLSVSVPPW